MSSWILHTALFPHLFYNFFKSLKLIKALQYLFLPGLKKVRENIVLVVLRLSYSAQMNVIWGMRVR